VAKGYGLGWEFLRVNGRQLINVDGGTANFQSSLFIDPAANVGVYIAANVVSALDAFSSPSGSTSLDGATTRGMAATVLSIVTKQPLPNEGPGHERLTLTFDLVIAVLTAALVIWVARTPMRLRSWADRGIVDTPALARRIGAIVVLNSALAIALLYLTLNVPAWKVIVEFQPDLGYWLDAVAAVLLIKGLVEVLFVTDAHRRVTRSSVRDVRLTKGDLDHA
jgi:hypothetical protein